MLAGLGRVGSTQTVMDVSRTTREVIAFMNGAKDFKLHKREGSYVVNIICGCGATPTAIMGIGPKYCRDCEELSLRCKCEVKV